MHLCTAVGVLQFNVRMITLLSELIGMPIYEDSMPIGPIALIRDVIIDPDTGALVAFMTHRRKVVLFRDARFFQSVFFIRSSDDLLEQDDVIRVHTILKKCPTLLGLPVYIDKKDEKNEYIGRVVDLEIDTSIGQLVSMYTSKLLLFLRYDDRIISAKSIVEITPDAVLIKDSSKSKARSKVEVELAPA